MATPMPTSIANLIMDHTADRLAKLLMTDVKDDAKAGLVRTGRLQDDPTVKRINILIHPGGEDYPDIIDDGTTGSIKHNIGGYMIAGPFGATMWRRRIRIQFELFFSRESTRVAPRTKANVVMSRARQALLNWNPGGEIPKDSFGEFAYQVVIIKHYLTEGGGEGEYNWRGDMIAEFLTEYQPLGE